MTSRKKKDSQRKKSQIRGRRKQKGSRKDGKVGSFWSRRRRSRSISRKYNKGKPPKKYQKLRDKKRRTSSAMEQMIQSLSHLTPSASSSPSPPAPSPHPPETETDFAEWLSMSTYSASEDQKLVREVEEKSFRVAGSLFSHLYPVRPPELERPTLPEEDQERSDNKNKNNPQDHIAQNDAEQCQICFENKRCIVLQPCGHFQTCHKCTNLIKLCPVCRSNITGKVVAFI